MSSFEAWNGIRFNSLLKAKTKLDYLIGLRYYMERWLLLKG